MDEDRASWPLVVGITAGVLGAIVAAAVLHSMRTHDDPDSRLRDAKEIIAQCHDKIKEIEASLNTLRQTETA